jgi:hypothetical protein
MEFDDLAEGLAAGRTSMGAPVGADLEAEIRSAA